ncbi:MAG TPA: hypothetical protein ENN65_08440 [Candidatus Hydrogenedentes bacterium]|nr:hypothetical protein [Candidatus Hydrogenedentota bacterium]
MRRIALDLTGRMSPTTGRREGGILGLTTQQAQYVLNARDDLAKLDPRYFSRAQRDRRFDPMVRRAMETGEPLGRADIERITRGYRNRLLDYRGGGIARDMTFTAQAAGRHEGMAQIGERDDIERVEKRWQHSGVGKEPREDHVEMNGTVKRIDEPFEFSDALMQYPHDPAGGARHSIGCKCIAVYRAVPVRG